MQRSLAYYDIFSGLLLLCRFKKMKCYSCKSLVSGRDDMLPDINSYFQGINRGSLLYPNDITINLVLYNYIVINKLVKNPSFLHSMNQRKLSVHNFGCFGK